MSEVFALSIEWPATATDPATSELTDVASFVVENRDDRDMVLAALATVLAGEVYRGGGGAEPEFTVRAVEPAAVRQHLDSIIARQAVAYSKDGREWAKLSALKPGDMLLCDGDFTCGIANKTVTVKTDVDGSLFVSCQSGAHSLAGQLADDGDHLVGMWPGTAGATTSDGFGAETKATSEPAAPEMPDLGEIDAALREIVAASDDYAATESDEAVERCSRALERCRALVAEIDAAMDANFGEAA